MNDSLGNPVKPDQVYLDSKDPETALHYIVIPNPNQEGRIHFITFLRMNGGRQEVDLPLNSQPTLYPISRENLDFRKKMLQGELSALESAVIATLNVSV